MRRELSLNRVQRILFHRVLIKPFFEKSDREIFVVGKNELVALDVEKRIHNLFDLRSALQHILLGTGLIWGREFFKLDFLHQAAIMQVTELGDQLSIVKIILLRRHIRREILQEKVDFCEEQNGRFYGFSG